MPLLCIERCQMEDYLLAMATLCCLDFFVVWLIACETSLFIVFALFSVLLKWLRYSFGVVFNRREKIMRICVEL